MEQFLTMKIGRSMRNGNAIDELRRNVQNGEDGFLSSDEEGFRDVVLRSNKSNIVHES